MLKIVLNTLIIIFSILIFSGCGAGTPMCVTFKDGTLYGSENYVLTAVYLEDKRVREKITDILAQCSDDNVELTIKKEYEGKEYPISLTEKNKWYSLTEEISKTSAKDFSTFAEAQTTTYIINSKKPTTLKFKAVGGDYCFNLENGKVSLENSFDVSKNFEIKIEKIAKTLDK